MTTLALFLLLAHPDFDIREAAQSHLEYLVDGWPNHYGPAVARFTATATDPEARARGVAVCRVYQRHRAAAFVPRSVPVWPICDAWPVLTPWGCGRDRGKLYPWLVAAGCRDTDQVAPYWTRYRRATEMWARRQIYDGASEEAVSSVLAKMWAVEQAHRGDTTPERWAESATWREWIGGYPGASKPSSASSTKVR